MEQYIGKLPAELRNPQQQKAYQEYMDNLINAISNDDDNSEPPPTNPLVRTYGIQSPLGRSMQTSLGSSTIQTIKNNLNFQEEDDED